ncbi:hypothetical protein COLO4_20480 [Corchorus olitorius]|uniref:Uncharacterized protein n=1 Tax=Corchorus olitorius TaxID=93759 RepID=A0A1R3IZQ9_9ROSI|nr:hypothetical protein COLO4_20480 [Corchorus olitorius]
MEANSMGKVTNGMDRVVSLTAKRKPFLRIRAPNSRGGGVTLFGLLRPPFYS